MPQLKITRMRGAERSVPSGSSAPEEDAPVTAPAPVPVLVPVTAPETALLAASRSAVASVGAGLALCCEPGFWVSDDWGGGPSGLFVVLSAWSGVR